MRSWRGTKGGNQRGPVEGIAASRVTRVHRGAEVNRSGVLHEKVVSYCMCSNMMFGQSACERASYVHTTASLFSPETPSERIRIACLAPSPGRKHQKKSQEGET